MRGWPGIVQWAAYLALDFFGSFLYLPARSRFGKGTVKTKRTSCLYARGFFTKLLLQKH
jgi:hypothetical protein